MCRGQPQLYFSANAAIGEKQVMQNQPTLLISTSSGASATASRKTPLFIPSAPSGTNSAISPKAFMVIQPDTMHTFEIIFSLNKCPTVIPEVLSPTMTNIFCQPTGPLCRNRLLCASWTCFAYESREYQANAARTKFYSSLKSPRRNDFKENLRSKEKAGETKISSQRNGE